MSATNVFKLSFPCGQECVGVRNFLSLSFCFDLSALPVLIAPAVLMQLTATAVAYRSCSLYASGCGCAFAAVCTSDLSSDQKACSWESSDVQPQSRDFD
jgi:hypothetical protein